MLATELVLPFQPLYRLAHPENYLFSLSVNIFSRSKYPKNIINLILKKEALNGTFDSLIFTHRAHASALFDGNFGEWKDIFTVFEWLNPDSRGVTGSQQGE